MAATEACGRDVGNVVPVTGGPSDAICCTGVTVWRSSHGRRKAALVAVDWTVSTGERWGVVGPNGAGKTTLLRIASAQMRPSAGTAFVLGEQLGRTDMVALRRRIGLLEPAFGRRFYPEQSALDVVLTGLSGSILMVDQPGDEEIQRGRELLDGVGMADFAARAFTSCSEGERARIMLARALITESELLVLDEPAGGLDLPGRELLLAALGRAFASRPRLTTLTVTHHIEELPPGTTHALLLAHGRVVAAGPVGSVLTDALLEECFGLPLRVEESAGRFFVRAI